MNRQIDSRDLPRGEELRISIDEYRGFPYLSLRKWYRKADVWLPGKGLTVRAELIPWLRALRDGETVPAEGGYAN